MYGMSDPNLRLEITSLANYIFEKIEIKSPHTFIYGCTDEVYFKGALPYKVEVFLNSIQLPYVTELGWNGIFMAKKKFVIFKGEQHKISGFKK